MNFLIYKSRKQMKPMNSTIPHFTSHEITYRYNVPVPLFLIEVKHSKMTWFCTLWLVRLITDCRILQFEILTFSVQYRLRHVYRESIWFHIPATKVFWEQQVRYFYFRRRLMKAFLKVQKHLAKSWDPFITRLNLTFKKVSITIFPWIIVIPQYY